MGLWVYLWPHLQPPGTLASIIMSISPVCAFECTPASPVTEDPFQRQRARPFLSAGTKCRTVKATASCLSKHPFGERNCESYLEARGAEGLIFYKLQLKQNQDHLSERGHPGRTETPERGGGRSPGCPVGAVESTESGDCPLCPWRPRTGRPLMCLRSPGPMAPPRFSLLASGSFLNF